MRTKVFEAVQRNGLIKIPQHLKVPGGKKLQVVLLFDDEEEEEKNQTELKPFREIPSAIVKPTTVKSFKFPSRDELHAR